MDTAVSFILQNFGSVSFGRKAQFMKASPTVILIYVYKELCKLWCWL